MLAWLAAFLVAPIAQAESFYLESDPIASRGLAADVVEVARGVGCPGEPQRRYASASGWEYVFRSEPSEDAQAVRACLDGMALPEGVTMHLVLHEADRRQVLATVPQPVVAEPAAAVVDQGPALDAADVWKRVLRAHAGASPPPRGGDVLFRFVRVTPEGDRVAHVYARRGEDVYLSVTPEGDHLASSRAGVAGGQAWVAGSQDALEPAHVRAQLDRFSPDAVLGWSSRLAHGEIPAETGARFAVQSGSEGAVVLKDEGSRVRTPVSVTVDAETWRLRAVSRGEAWTVVRWTFQGWVSTGQGTLRPTAVEVHRGSARLDRVEVEELELSPTLPDQWFTPEG